MTEVVFWALLSLLNWDKSGDDTAVIEPVIIALSEKSAEEILQFEDILAEKLHSLDTISHAKEIGEDSFVDEMKYFSADWFLYARCVVVANGDELYKEVLSHPKEFPKDMEFEALLSIGPSAYARKTGKEYSYVTKVSYETYSNIRGWK
jgi:hypothetical protein